MRAQVVVCQHCGAGWRVRVQSGTSACVVGLAPLEPPDDKRQQAMTSGALKGWQ